jgi:hypothetical protein
MNILNGLNPCSKQHATADDTWIMGDIRGTSVTRYTTFGTVNHSVLFGMDGGLFVTFPNDGTVIASRQESVVSLAYDSMVRNKKTSYVKTFAGASCSSYLDNFFEVIVPGRAGHMIDNTPFLF